MSKISKVLVFIDWYYPAFKAGGPIRSISNMISLLSEDINFFIVTGDRDLLDKKPFKYVKFNAWIKQDNYSIIYTSSPDLCALTSNTCYLLVCFALMRTC